MSIVALHVSKTHQSNSFKSVDGSSEVKRQLLPGSDVLPALDRGQVLGGFVHHDGDSDGHQNVGHSREGSQVLEVAHHAGYENRDYDEDHVD